MIVKNKMFEGKNGGAVEKSQTSRLQTWNGEQRHRDADQSISAVKKSLLRCRKFKMAPSVCALLFVCPRFACHNDKMIFGLKKKK